MTISAREHPRYAHEAAVRCHVGGKRIEGRTRNVSRGGLCADVADPIAVGADIQVDLVLVFDAEVQSEPLRLPARVVWCTTLDDGYQIGLAFRPLDAQALEYLTMFLRFLDDERDEEKPAGKTVDDLFK